MKFTELTLLTSNLHEMKHFYENILDLKIIKSSTDYFSVKVGSTAITFKQSLTETEPFYHFAINIPENRIVQAKSWIQTRVELNTEEDLDEVFFKSWNAHAVYFEDPSGNIVELIARHNLKNAIEHDFTSEDFLYISEMGLVADSVIPMVRKLNNLGIPNWREDSEGLTPVGDEIGLFITVRRERRWYFSKQNALFYPFTATVEGIGRLVFSETNKVEVEKVKN